MRRFTVELDDTDFRALTRLAVEARRDVRDQAAVLLEARLRAARRRLTDGQSGPQSDGSSALAIPYVGQG